MEGTAEITLELNDWIAGAVFPSKTIVDILPAIPLAERRPVSRRIGQRFIHPDRDVAVFNVGFSPEGSRIIGSNYPKNTIQVWDSKTGEQLATIETPDELRGLDFWKSNRDFSRLYTWEETVGESEVVQVDGQTATKAAYPESGISVWDISSGKLIETIQSSPPNQVLGLSITPRKTHLISLENLPGTFVDKRPQIHRMLNLETGEWTLLSDDISNPVIDNAEQRAVSFVPDESGMYIAGISVVAFPSFSELQRLNLPPGVHGLGGIQITDDNNHLIVDFRTYERKGEFNKWKTTVLCIELETGKQVGKYDFPFDNDSPLIARDQLSNETIVLGTWRASPKRVIALQFPEMEPKWETELGDYVGVAPGLVSPDGQWTAFRCQVKSTALEAAGVGPVDWDLVPQNELKIIGADGLLLETMVLPVGAMSLAISNDGKTAAVGALGSVYLLDLSRPFENERE